MRGRTCHVASHILAANYAYQGSGAARHAETLANARRRNAEEGLKVLGLRFHGYALFCRAARFATLRRELGDGFGGHELPKKLPGQMVAKVHNYAPGRSNGQ